MTFFRFGSVSWELQVWDFADMGRSGAAPLRRDPKMPA
jgi:hypothetical protein